MKLALRRGYKPDSTWYEKLGVKFIEYRLVTNWTHAGIVVGNTLFHATAKGGLISEDFDNSAGNWDLFDCGDEHDERTIKQFEDRLRKGRGKVRYDWFSLLAFTPAILVAKLFDQPIRYRNWLYCYEWSYEVLTQRMASSEITPEDLLEIYIKNYK